MDNVITLNSKKKAQEEDRKQQLLEVIDVVRTQIEHGQIQEFVACSLDKDGIAQIHVSTLDYAGGIGLFEIGKHTLIQAKL
jgi:hypothetical protein